MGLPPNDRQPSYPQVLASVGNSTSTILPQLCLKSNEWATKPVWPLVCEIPFSRAAEAAHVLFKEAKGGSKLQTQLVLAKIQELTAIVFADTIFKLSQYCFLYFHSMAASTNMFSPDATADNANLAEQKLRLRARRATGTHRSVLV